MPPASDIGSKRLIGLAPDAWARWVTQQPDLVAEEIVAADFQVHILTDESEAGTKFEEELADVGQEAALEFALVGVVGECEEVG